MPDSLAQLRAALARLPRLRLAHLPTPLVEAPRLTAKLSGPRILVKREDLAGLGTGGSKYRILELTLATALDRGADSLIAAGMIQSNHPQQVAVAAARLGMPALLLLGDASGPLVWQGNVLLEHLCGAEIRLVRGADLEALREAQEVAAEELRARGKRPAIVTLTREVYVLSVLAYASFILELTDQLRNLDRTIDAVYVGSGGGTYAGMVLATLVLGRPFRIIGFTPTGTAAGRRQYVIDLLAEAIDRLGLHLPIDADAIEISDEYLGAGYGIPSAGGTEAIRLTASTEGIFLDPVYSGKAMAGLIDHARRGKLNRQTVLFTHTGGLPSLFAYADHMVPEPKVSL